MEVEGGGEVEEGGAVVSGRHYQFALSSNEQLSFQNEEHRIEHFSNKAVVRPHTNSKN